MSVSRLDILLIPPATSVEFLFLSSFTERLLGPGGRSKLRTLPLRDTYIHTYIYTSFLDENKPVASCSKRNEIFLVPVNSSQSFFPSLDRLYVCHFYFLFVKIIKIIIIQISLVRLTKLSSNEKFYSTSFL